MSSRLIARLGDGIVIVFPPKAGVLTLGDEIEVMMLDGDCGMEAIWGAQTILMAPPIGEQGERRLREASQAEVLCMLNGGF